LHPYFLKYQNYIKNQFTNKKEIIGFLEMIKLKERKLKWALTQTDKKNKELANICGIKTRRFQQLKSIYKQTGEIPKLNINRRPKIYLTEKQIGIIDDALEKSKLEGAVTLRLHIKKNYNVTIPKNKLHQYLLKKGISKEDKKKQKQRKYCRYERKHSFSLGHMDYHESKCIPNKQVILWTDDSSRLILSGDEFDEATTQNAIEIVNKAKEKAWEDYSAPKFDN
jgi:putative transposase